MLIRIALLGATYSYPTSHGYQTISFVGLNSKETSVFILLYEELAFWAKACLNLVSNKHGLFPAVVKVTLRIGTDRSQNARVDRTPSYDYIKPYLWYSKTYRSV